jgi:hypothetical protein
VSPQIPSNVQNAQYGGVNNAGRMRKLAQPVVLNKGPAYGKEHTDDRALDAVQQRANDATQAARANPLSSCNFIRGLTFVSGKPLTVQHGLGRVFSSCLLAGQSAYGSIAVQRPAPALRPASTQNTLDARQITITPTFSGIADLLVW